MNTQEQFNQWLNTMADSESPPDEIVAYNLGIFETASGYCLYLTGSKVYDEADSDWACRTDFEPKEKYFELTGVDFENSEWKEVMEMIAALLKSYMSTEEFRNSFLNKAKAITTGFDDGDLERIK